MGWFGNLKIGTKIAAGIGASLTLLVVLGITGYLALTEAKGDFSSYRALARETNAAGRIQANMLETRIYAKSFLLTGTDDSIQHLKDRADLTERIIAETKPLFVKPETVKQVETIDGHLRDYQAAFRKIAELQKQRAAEADRLHDAGARMEQALAAIMDGAYGDGDAAAAYLAGQTLRHVLKTRISATRFLLSGLSVEADARPRRTARGSVGQQ